MAWTYSGNPSASSKDAVRFLVGDTQAEAPLAQDEEITWALTENPNIYAAAAQIASSIAIYFATQAQSIKIGPLTEQYTSRAKDYRDLTLTLKTKATERQGLNIYAGGIEDRSPIENLSVGMHDNNGSD